MMCGIEDTEASSEGLRLLNGTSNIFSEGEQRKFPDFFDSSMNQPYGQQQHSLGLTRYASAPSSFFENIIGSGSTSGIDSTACEDIRYPQSANPVSEDMFTGFLHSDGSGNSESLHKYGERYVKQEERSNDFQQHGYMNNGTQLLYHNSQVYGSQNDNTENIGNTMSSPFSGINTTAMDNMVHEKMSTGSCNNLARQRSSPADFFSNLSAENGFAVSKMNTHVNYSNGSSTSSKFMPQITETENKNMGTNSLEYRNPADVYGTKRHRLSKYSGDFWDDSVLDFAKRPKDNDRNNTISAMDSFKIQNGSYNDHTYSLSHHLSLPKSYGETDVSEKFLNFQDAVPCKIRAKRGFATHPRSIAERVRRTRISERIRKLQELFPNIDKHTNTSDMLETAVECIKKLQKQVRTLTDAKDKCLCDSKQEE